MLDDEEVSADALLNGRVRLLQRRRGHRAGTDAVLLAHLPDPKELGAGLVVDAGAGSGAAGLIVAARAPLARVILVERDPTLAALGRRNIALNGWGERARSAEADLFARGLPAVLDIGPGADWVITNPPYLDEARERPSPDPGRAAAHLLPPQGLGGWLRACARLVKPGGHLGLIQRADRLPGCLAALERGFGALALRPVHPRERAAAHRILLTAVKGSRAPPAILPPLVLHRLDGTFTEEAARLHGAWT